jgi:hypothetical protein
VVIFAPCGETSGSKADALGTLTRSAEELGFLGRFTSNGVNLFTEPGPSGALDLRLRFGGDISYAAHRLISLASPLTQLSLCLCLSLQVNWQYVESPPPPSETGVGPARHRGA